MKASILIAYILSTLAYSSPARLVECIIDDSGDGPLSQQSKLNFPIGSTASLVEQAGYIAEEYNVPTKQAGYVINLVRVRNRLIEPSKDNNNRTIIRRPVVFIHGLSGNANTFIMMGIDKGKPNDWSQFDEAKLSKAELRSLIRSDLKSRAMPFLMSNFGYDVWLMNRRNTRDSRRVSPKFNEAASEIKLPISGAKKLPFVHRPFANDQHDLDPKVIWRMLKGKTLREKLDSLVIDYIANISHASYYRYSYDEQAKYDLPAVIDFVLENTKQSKLDVIGHSAGCLVIAMLLASNPMMASKINHAALLAPAVILHYETLESPFMLLFQGLQPFFAESLGTINGIEFITASSIVSLFHCMLRKIKHLRPCSGSTIDQTLGLGSFQFDLLVAVKYFAIFTDDSSLQEYAQLIQNGHLNQPAFMDFMEPQRNALAYGSFKVPIYDLSKISLDSMSIWQGNTDRMVNQFDTSTFLDLLNNTWDFHVIGNKTTGIHFNHFGFQLHTNVTNLLNIPLLKRIASSRENII